MLDINAEKGRPEWPRSFQRDSLQGGLFVATDVTQGEAAVARAL